MITQVILVKSHRRNIRTRNRIKESNVINRGNKCEWVTYSSFIQIFDKKYFIDPFYEDTGEWSGWGPAICGLKRCTG